MQTTTYKLNISPGGVPLTIHISQYDVGLREFTFEPFTNVGSFSYVEGATVTLEATKPDGYAVIHACEYNNDGSITYTLQDQLAAVPGRVWSKVVIRDGADVLGTGAILWVVDYAGVKDDAIISDSDISALQQWMDDVEDYAEQADGSAQAAASAVSLAESAVASAQEAATQAAGYVDQAVILGGTPLVAATVSAMTNHDRVYVYTGSETGYTAGNWYYWNGSAWTSGGIYNSSAVQTDPTLSISGMAADAAATGELKSETTSLVDVTLTYKPVKMTFQKGRFLNNGFSVNDNYCRNVTPLPAGKYLMPAYSTYSHLPVEYISDTSGVFLTSGWVTGETVIESENPIYINFSKTSAWTNTELANLANSFTVSRINDSSLESKMSTDISTVTSVSSIFSEVYIVNGNKDNNVRRVVLSDGVGDIAIGDASDWCCWRTFTSEDPAVVGKVYEIPEYRDSGVTAYVVLKTNDVTTTSSGTALGFTNAVYERWKMPTIDNYLTNVLTVLKNTVGITTQKIVFLGDSIFGLERDSTSIPLLTGVYLGAESYNCALGGTEGNSHGDASWSNFDFVALSQAIANDDYSVQQAHLSDEGIPSYFSDVITELSSIDFSEVSIVCLTYGGNDYANNHSDVSAFVTAMETSINRILTAYPNIRFLLMNPPYKRFLDNTTHEFIDDGDTRANTFGKTLRDYAESYKTISEAVHAPYINAYDDLGINRYNASQWFITNDGSHPSEQGRKETAKLIAQYLKRMLYD